MLMHTHTIDIIVVLSFFSLQEPTLIIFTYQINAYRKKVVFAFYLKEERKFSTVVKKCRLDW